MKRPALMGAAGRSMAPMLPVEEPTVTLELIRDRYDRLVERLRSAAAAAGRDPDGFRIVAVTKGFGLDVVRAALAAGLTMLGENRVQEAAVKVEAAPEADWHMVGQLQSNKVRPALRLFGKPEVQGERRMGVCLAKGANIDDARARANAMAEKVHISLE